MWVVVGAYWSAVGKRTLAVTRRDAWHGVNDQVERIGRKRVKK